MLIIVVYKILHKMKIEHLAIWVRDLEIMKEFYQEYFNMHCGKKYENKMKKFSSYFLSFNEGARLELMHSPVIPEYPGNDGITRGFAHMAISVGSKKEVDRITELIRAAGFAVTGEPRTTGDGYYESVILDPEGNLVELSE